LTSSPDIAGDWTFPTAVAVLNSLYALDDSEAEARCESAERFLLDTPPQSLSEARAVLAALIHVGDDDRSDGRVRTACQNLYGFIADLERG
jgi:hypothetical protein